MPRPTRPTRQRAAGGKTADASDDNEGEAMAEVTGEGEAEDGEAEAGTEEEFFAQELLKAGGEVLTKVDGPNLAPQLGD